MKERECKEKGGKKKGKGRNKSEGKGEIKGRKKRGECVNGEGREERGKGRKNRKGKDTIKKKSVLETKLLHNTLKHRREMRHQQKTHYVIS